MVHTVGLPQVTSLSMQFTFRGRERGEEEERREKRGRREEERGRGYEKRR